MQENAKTFLCSIFWKQFCTWSPNVTQNKLIHNQFGINDIKSKAVVYVFSNITECITSVWTSTVWTYLFAHLNSKTLSAFNIFLTHMHWKIVKCWLSAKYPLYDGPIWYNVSYKTTMTDVELRSNFEFTKRIYSSPLAIRELWSVLWVIWRKMTITADTWWNNNDIIMSKRRRFETLLLRLVSAGRTMG